MKNKFTVMIILVLIAMVIFFIVFDILKFNKISGYIISGLVYGFILNILYKKLKST
ncbi:hypothetical protein QJR30_18265 (plasmid) [Paraclostridium sordellii]|uniref:hypothetical protein n=1 Tax=Paraclostridium sordellii TaxID=1505 RepID=UPI0005DE51C5|nr:hypothetical protein [Paeniclostridium sordellii]CEP41116.1 Uncharacterised protein [[Clostridium] sordellii] [Paeniclostridium sordellii]